MAERKNIIIQFPVCFQTYSFTESHVATVLDIKLDPVLHWKTTRGCGPRPLLDNVVGVTGLWSAWSRHGDESLADNSRSESHSAEQDGEDYDDDGQNSGCYGEGHHQDVIGAITNGVRDGGGGRGNDGDWREMTSVSMIWRLTQTLWL